MNRYTTPVDPWAVRTVIVMPYSNSCMWTQQILVFLPASPHDLQDAFIWHCSRWQNLWQLKMKQVEKSISMQMVLWSCMLDVNGKKENVEESIPVCGGFQVESVYAIYGTRPSCSLLKLRLCLAASRTLAPCCMGPKIQMMEWKELLAWSNMVVHYLGIFIPVVW